MSSINQNIRFSNYGTENNPKALFDFIKPSRWIFNNVNPLPDSGEDKWFYLNTLTGDLFEKTNGTWFLVYNFTTGPSGGITNIEDETPGFFKAIVGNTAFFKGIAGDPVANEIFVDQADANTVYLSIEPSYKPITLSNVNNVWNGIGTFSPNGLIGTELGAIQGSMFVQLPRSIWTCQNPTTKTWSKASNGEGILDIVNVAGEGEGLVIGVDTEYNGLFKKISSTSGDIDVSALATSVDLNVSPSFVPLLLDKVPNVYNNFGGSAFGPTVNDDITQGYQKGSIYTQLTGTIGDIWVCADNTAGAAVWRDVGNKTSVLKDFAQFDWVPSIDNQTTFTGPTRVTLNTGTNPFSVTNFKIGTLSSVKVVEPYYVVQRSNSANGLANNIYRFTINASFAYVTSNVSDPPTHFQLSVQDGIGNRPTDPVYPSSIYNFYSYTGSLVRNMYVSYSFFFKSPISNTEYYNFCVANLTNTRNLILNDLKFNIEQVN